MSLTSLADELIECILDHLDEGSRDIVNLSTTCKRFHNQLIPRVYHTVVFSNVPRISNSAYAAAAAYGHHIKKLRFIAYHPDRRYYCSYGKMEPELEILPRNALELFKADSALLPALEGIILSFTRSLPIRWELENDLLECPSVASSEGSPTTIGLNEETSITLRLLANTLKALSTNLNTTSLEVEDWIPYKVSTTTTPEWHEYMARLKTFKISLIAPCDDTDQEMNCFYTPEQRFNTSEQYNSQITDMKDYFFNHLTSVTTFRMKGSDYAPLGSSGHCSPQHIDLPNEGPNMQALGHVEITNLFVGPQLLGLLIAHRDSLRTVILRDADVCTRCLQQDWNYIEGVSWEDFFDTLTKTDFPSLSTFELKPDGPLESWRSWMMARPANIQDEKTREKFAAIFERQEEYPQLRLFHHACLNENTGAKHALDDDDVKCFWEGKAQAAYDRFMRKLRSRT